MESAIQYTAAMKKIAISVVKQVATSMAGRVMKNMSKGAGASKDASKDKEAAPKLKLSTIEEVTKTDLSR